MTLADKLKEFGREIKYLASTKEGIAILTAAGVLAVGGLVAKIASHNSEIKFQREIREIEQDNSEYWKINGPKGREPTEDEYLQIKLEIERLQEEQYKINNPVITPKTNSPNKSKTIPKKKNYINTAEEREEGIYASKKPTKRIFSDQFFRNSDYLTEEQINLLLAQNKSCLQNTGIAETIVQACKKYDVNPIYVLGRLQQEQGLLTKRKANKKQLAYATGYGARDDVTLPSGGLHYQVRKTAEKLDELAERYDGTQKVRVDYGKRTINPETNAEYALLCYTPHTAGLHLSKKILTNLDERIKNL